MITQQDQLEALVARARQADVVALDTEFVWERTYFPQLGVVQLGLGPDDVHLLDAVALDLAPLGALLADPAVVKLLHDAKQDLTILRRATGASPRNAFDTQLAAGFIGLGASISLQGLIQALAGVHLPKGATRSDWLRRPLSAEQTAYAEDDVRYLPEAYRALMDQLAERKRTGWAAEEMAALDAPALFEEDDPAERYRSVKGRAKKTFGARDYAVLREVTAWREHEARQRDRPRGHIVTDDALLEIAQRKPDSPDALRRIRALSDAARQRYGDAIVGAVQRALALPKEDWPPRPAKGEEDPTLASRLDLVQALIRGRGQREGVDPALVASRAEVERLVAGSAPSPERHAVLRGWRRDFVGADIEALLGGRAALALDPEGLPLAVPVDG